jgi:dihydrofolate reductase
MGKIIISEFLTLDGVAESPTWTAPYWGDDIGHLKKDELFSAEALLLGKNTYEMFALAWPGRIDEEGYSERINTMPKYVVTSHTNALTWNAKGILADPEEIKVLKENTKGDLLVFGSLSLVRMLLKEKLADEVRILLYPLMVNEGRKLFDTLNVDLELINQRSFNSGVVELYYKVK